jgi:hypothetical protein
VTVFVGAGSTVEEMGTIKVWGCQHEATANQPYLTSYVPTVGSAVARAQATGSFSATGISSAVVSTGSTAATVVLPSILVANIGGFVQTGGSARLLYNQGASLGAYDGTNTVTRASGIVANTARRIGSSWTGTTLTLYDITGGASTAGTFDGAMDDGSVLQVGCTTTNTCINGVEKMVCLDSRATRCAP